MSNEFEISIEGNFIAQFGKTKKNIEKLAQRALRKTALQTETEIEKILQQHKLIDHSLKSLRQSKVLRRYSDLKSGIDQMNIRITVSDKPQNTYRFWPTYVTSGKKGYWYGTIAGRRQKLADGKAFFKGKWKTTYYRQSTDRYPWVKFKGPSVGELLTDGSHIPRILRLSSHKLRVNLLKAMGKELEI